MKVEKIGTPKRLLNATIYSIKGIKTAWQNEASFRQEIVLTLILLPVAFWVGVTATQRALLIFSILIVLIVELINSAIEAVIDRIGVEHHPLSERAKNLASAAVFFSLIATLFVWIIIIYQRLY